MTSTSGLRIASDFNCQGHEESNFPILCETCLGDNPYVRMTRENSAKECKICARPYTVFRWKPGPKARFKSTIICQTCSKLKNVCQTCIFDLEFGLPVQVRDKFLESQHVLALPESRVNRDYMASQLDKMSEQMPYGKSPSQQLMLAKLARTQPYYRRNRPHVCTFWKNNSCTRGEQCPFLHEEEEHDPTLASQNIKDRYTGKNDPVANKIFKSAQMISENQSLIPPDDKTITSLCIGGLTDDINEKDIRDSFYSYGEIKSIKMVPRQKCAFVSYTTRKAAEAAAQALYTDFEIKGERLRLSWGKGIRSQPVSAPIQTLPSGQPIQPLQPLSVPSSVLSHILETSNPNAYQYSHLFPTSSSASTESSAPIGNQTVVYASTNPVEAEHRK